MCGRGEYGQGRDGHGNDDGHDDDRRDDQDDAPLVKPYGSYGYGAYGHGQGYDHGSGGGRGGGYDDDCRVDAKSKNARQAKENWRFSANSKVCWSRLYNLAGSIVVSSIPDSKTEVVGKYIEMGAESGYYGDGSRGGGTDHDSEEQYCEDGNEIRGIECNPEVEGGLVCRYEKQNDCTYTDIIRIALIRIVYIVKVLLILENRIRRQLILHS